MKTKCKAGRANGSICHAAATETGYCFMHDPGRGEERAAARRKGGYNRSTPNSEIIFPIPEQVRRIEDVFKVLDFALAEAVPLQNSVQRGRLLISLAHGYIEALKAGELEARLNAIEHALKLRPAA